MFAAPPAPSLPPRPPTCRFQPDRHRRVQVARPAQGAAAAGHPGGRGGLWVRLSCRLTSSRPALPDAGCGGCTVSRSEISDQRGRTCQLAGLGIWASGGCGSSGRLCRSAVCNGLPRPRLPSTPGVAAAGAHHITQQHPPRAAGWLGAQWCRVCMQACSRLRKGCAGGCSPAAAPRLYAGSRAEDDLRCLLAAGAPSDLMCDVSGTA